MVAIDRRQDERAGLLRNSRTLERLTLTCTAIVYCGVREAHAIFSGER